MLIQSVNHLNIKSTVEMRPSVALKSTISKRNENIRAKVVTDVSILTTASLSLIRRNRSAFVEFQIQQ